MKRFFKAIGGFFKTLAKCTFKEVISLILDLLSIACGTPSLFINFFIVFFLTNREMTTSEKGSAFLIIGVILTLWIWFVSIIKRQMMDHNKPFERILLRLFYKIKYLLILGAVMYIYTLNSNYMIILGYLGCCVLTYSFNVIFRALWLKVNGKDWMYEYSKRSIKF